MRSAFGRHTETLKDEDILEIGHFVPEPQLGKDFTRYLDITPGETPESSEEFPVVAIGRPETKNLKNLLEKDDLEKLDGFIRDDMKRYDFYFVRLWCSFRPKTEKTALASAHLTFVLKPDEMRRWSQVYTMYPTGIYDSIKETSKMGFDASLKLVPIFGVTPELKGTIETGVEYPKLVPKIVAHFNANQSGTIWDFDRTPADELRGVRYLYLLARTPLGSKKLVARLNLSAKINFTGKISRYIYAPWAEGAPTQEINLLSEIGEVAHPSIPT